MDGSVSSLEVILFGLDAVVRLLMMRSVKGSQMTPNTLFLLLCVRRACVVLGIVFVLSSLCILGKAIHNLATRMPPEVVRHTHTHIHNKTQQQY